MADVALGTLYDLNKNAMDSIPKLGAPAIAHAKKEFIKYFLEQNAEYYMLLCKEQSDYSIVHMLYRDETEYSKMVDIIVDECCVNRGSLLSVEKTEDGMAFELWIRIEKENFVYYLFPYDNAIIEVEEY